MHWLELMHLRLAGAYQSSAINLLYCPWEYDLSIVKASLPKRIVKLLLTLQESVHYLVFRKRFNWRRINIEKIAIYVVAYPHDTSPIELPIGAAVNAELYVGMIREDLTKAGISWQDVNELGQAALIALYIVSEAVVYMLAGMLDCKWREGDLCFTVPQQFVDAYKLAWFARFWANQSNFQDDVVARYINLAIRDAAISGVTVRKHPSFKYFVNYVSDRHATLNSRYLKPMRVDGQDQFPAVRNRLALLTYIWLQTVRDYSDTDIDLNKIVISGEIGIAISEENLRQSGFSQFEIDNLLAESEAASPEDQIISRGRNGEIHVHNISLKFAMQKYMRTLLEKIGGDPRGNWFEKEYLVKYLEENLDETRYSVKPGFKADETEPHKFDVDFIIVDRCCNRFYFCQVKHRIAFVQPYLRDILNQYSSNGQIKKAIRQLQNLQPIIDSPNIRRQIKECVGHEFIGDEPLAPRSGYIVLHNLESLDFCTRDGIALYEWNTFRNIVIGHLARIHLSSTNPEDIFQECRYILENVCLDNPHAVAERLIQIYASQIESFKACSELSPAKQYNLYKSAHMYLILKRVLRWGDIPLSSKSNLRLALCLR